METATPEMKTKVFDFYDSNQDGKVTAAEIKDVDLNKFGKDETIEGIMETVTQIDKNGDQAIELNELLEWTPTPEGPTPGGSITSCPAGSHMNPATPTEPCCTRCDPDNVPSTGVNSCPQG